MCIVSMYPLGHQYVYIVPNTSQDVTKYSWTHYVCFYYQWYNLVFHFMHLFKTEDQHCGWRGKLWMSMVYSWEIIWFLCLKKYCKLAIFWQWNKCSISFLHDSFMRCGRIIIIYHMRRHSFWNIIVVIFWNSHANFANCKGLLATMQEASK